MGRETQEAFEALTNALSADTVLAHFEVKRGREIKSRNSSHCKLLKHARGDEYVAVDLDQEGLATSSAEETETGAREDLRLQPDNLGASSEMTIGGPRNEPDGPPTSLGATETEGHQPQPDDTAVSGPIRSARARTSTWNTFYRGFEPH